MTGASSDDKHYSFCASNFTKCLLSHFSDGIEDESHGVNSRRPPRTPGNNFTLDALFPSSSDVKDKFSSTVAGEYQVLQFPSEEGLGMLKETSRSGTAEIDTEKGGVDNVLQDNIAGTNIEEVHPSHSTTRLNSVEEQVGELCIHADGRVQMTIGETEYDILKGTLFKHREQVACIDASSSKIAFLGHVPGRLMCVPDVTGLV